jgi:hypothetical protein
VTTNIAPDGEVGAYKAGAIALITSARYLP